MLDEQIQVRKVEYDGLQEKLKASTAKLKEVVAIGETNETISSKLEAIKLEVAGLEAKIEPFVSSGAKLVTEKELQKAESDLKKWQLEWKKRKRATTDVINQISESMDMNNKVFATKVGIETDEEFKVVCPI